jgi:predicted metal-dependent phosphoesterase TrpH
MKSVREERMKKYDLHTHTNFSPDSRIRPESILQRARAVGLSGVAITDHHTIKGALLTRELNKDKDFEVVIGEEITSHQGDVIAIFIERHIEERDLFKIVENVRSQGGLVIIPHPFRPLQRFAYSLASLVGRIDAVETLNSRNPDSSNKAAAKAIGGLPLAAVGSSDAHILADIGNGYTVFEGELREAIKERRTVSAGSNRLFNAFRSHFAASWIKGSEKILRHRNK